MCKKSERARDWPVPSSRVLHFGDLFSGVSVLPPLGKGATRAVPRCHPGGPTFPPNPPTHLPTSYPPRTGLLARPSPLQDVEAKIILVRRERYRNVLPNSAGETASSPKVDTLAAISRKAKTTRTARVQCLSKSLNYSSRSDSLERASTRLGRTAD